MHDIWSFGLYTTIIGITVVMSALGFLALVTWGTGLVDRRLRRMERRPVLGESAVDPRIAAAICAVIADLEGKRFKIHRIRYLSGAAEDENAWQELAQAQTYIHRQSRFTR